MGETLREKLGPLPLWAWMMIGIAILAYILYKRNQSTSTTSTTGTTTDTTTAPTTTVTAQQQPVTDGQTVPVSNLTGITEPMPIQTGDTFVAVPEVVASAQPPPGSNVLTSGTTSSDNIQPANPPAPPPAPVPAGGTTSGT